MAMIPVIGSSLTASAPLRFSWPLSVWAEPRAASCDSRASGVPQFTWEPSEVPMPPAMVRGRRGRARSARGGRVAGRPEVP